MTNAAILLGDLVHPGAIATSLDAPDKYAAIESLVDLLIAAGDLPAEFREHATGIVSAREHSLSTGMEHGIALPHAASDRIDRRIAALATAPEGIPWDSLDGSPARLIILLISPRREFNIHVRTLAGISHLLNRNAFVESLVAAPDPEALHDLIQDEESGSWFERFRRRLQGH